MGAGVKVDFTFSRELRERLWQLVAVGQRSRFVATAVKEKLAAVERERLKAVLREGYIATRDENAEINREWETATLEKWPE